MKWPPSNSQNKLTLLTDMIDYHWLRQVSFWWFPDWFNTSLSYNFYISLISSMWGNIWKPQLNSDQVIWTTLCVFDNSTLSRASEPQTACSHQKLRWKNSHNLIFYLLDLGTFYFTKDISSKTHKTGIYFILLPLFMILIVFLVYPALWVTGVPTN